MKATKHTFELVARILRTERDAAAIASLGDRGASVELLDRLTLAFADAFDGWHKTHSGARFDREKFLKGCGYRAHWRAAQ